MSILKKAKQHAKSKTINTNAIIAVLGVIELNLHLVENSLGQYYGFAFIAVAAINMYLRTITTQAIEDK